LLLEAQAVPTAELIPCIAGIPAGWSYQGMDVRDGAATIFMDSDRAGFRAVEVNFTRTCDLTDTTEVASDEQGTRQFDRIFEVGENIVATRYYTFRGGCTTIQFRLAGESAAELIHEASLAIGFFQRSEGAQIIEQNLGVEL
jgi:hypothetical protein